jgi:starch synthase
VTSIYDNPFQQVFSERIVNKIKMDGISESDLELVAKGASFADLSKLAIQYSDGVIQGSESILPELVDFTNQSQKMFLPYQEPQNYVTAYNQFYDQILGK